jgi:hypothetical protein
MTRVQALFEEFRQDAVSRGGLLLFPAAAALEVIEQARVHGLKLLGIDGIYLEGKFTRPSMEDSVDFSLKSYVGDSYSHGVEFIKRHERSGLFFELVISE